ncbi:MAG: glucose-6-phosphate isomerase family protein [Nanoarchaeota archaeon]|nr:glucose-6-phosphate isomerase family protein [Nanoarchaeota archaeon]
MIDLKKISGLPLIYTDKLISKKIKVPKPKIRKLKDIKNILYKPITDKANLYYMYRNITNQKRLFKKHNLRYDITIMPPRIIGKEYVKTKGHFHPKIPNSNLTYPEIYEILNGKACLLLQKKENEKITEVKVIKVKKGDRIIIPPNFGHITINASNKTLIMANIVSSKFKSEYKDIMKKKGGAYFGLASKKGIKFVKNKNYKNLPKLKKQKIESYNKINIPLHECFVKSPKKFAFLNNGKGVKYDNN